MIATKLADAITAALRDIHRLKKDERNNHGGYAYVSVDDVKDHVRPILCKHGLSLSCTEQEFELLQVAGKSGHTTCARIVYGMTLRHVSGEEAPPEVITIVLPYTGAQTAGAARSYAVKEWMKSTLLVSTGEKDAIIGGADADAYAPQDYVSKDKSSYQARKDGDDKEFVRIQTGLHDIEKNGALEDLVLFWTKNWPVIKAMKAEWLKTLTEQKDALKAEFEKGHDRPLVEAAE